MPTLLISHAELLVTMDAERREIADGAVFARDGVIDTPNNSAGLARMSGARTVSSLMPQVSPVLLAAEPVSPIAHVRTCG